MTIALVCPDGLSILLFCKGIIGALRRIPGARVIVVSDIGEHGRDIEALGVTCIDVPMARFLDPRRDFQYLWRLTRTFRRERCDLVFNFSTKANIYGAIAAHLARVPRVVSHVVGMGGAFLPADTAGGKLLQALVLRLYDVAFRLTDKVWFTNRSDLAFFTGKGLVGPDKSVLTRNYLDVSAYAGDSIAPDEIAEARRELHLGPHDRVVIMVARMAWAKGVREFAEAAEQLKDRYPEALFLLVAPLETGSRDAVPESYIRKMEGAARLRWLGFRSDVKRLYAMANLAVLPSYYKEGGYPRALLEPMAMGKPIIAADTEDCRGPVEEGRNGYLVPPRDSHALAEAVARLLDDRARCDAFGRYGRFKAERDFDERRIVVDALVALGVLPALAAVPAS
jgi:glycosyltransferase involved in cell wall biosynthesis